MIHDKARCQLLFCDLCLNPKVAASQGREEEAQAERGDGMLHDYAGCLFPLCAECQGYAEGYAAGKQKAHAEVRLWELGAHEPDCGCNPCLSCPTRTWWRSRGRCRRAPLGDTWSQRAGRRCGSSRPPGSCESRAAASCRQAAQGVTFTHPL